ncbi:MAG: hypothetical protein MPN21_05285 [Thermoanaerobaculia bacterium]|nr:hypothetical protein [Thermoanaerobaculia bacterium]
MMTDTLRCLVVLASLTALFPSDADAENGSCRWSTDFSVSGLDGPVLAIASEETGSGRRIYVGGHFAAVDGYLANHIAVWADGRWSVLEVPGGVGVNGPVRALTFWDDGTGPALYVGGDFTSAGGVVVDNIARWQDGEWSALGSGSAPGVSSNQEFASFQVQDLLPFDDGTGSALYVTGSFSTAGGRPANGLARWDGTAWSAPLLDPSVRAASYSLSLWDDGTGESLYVGVSKLEDGRLLPLGGVDISDVLDVTVWNDGSGETLFLAGSLETLGRDIAKWTGSKWQLIGRVDHHSHDVIWSLESLQIGDENLLVAGGRFQTIGGVPASLIMAYDGTEWRNLGDPPAQALEGFEIRTLATVDIDGPKLVAGGDFTAVASKRTTHFALWDGSNWEAPTSGVPHRGGILGSVHTIAEWDDGTGLATYVGGCFLYASGERANHIAKWESGRWVPLRGPDGVGVSDTVFALTVWDDGTGPALYAGGTFDTAGGIEVNGVARWNGRSWSALEGPMGVGLGGRARALVSWNDGAGSDLYVGGYFFTAGAFVSVPKTAS